MKLSQTEEGLAWVAQFGIPDQADATLLLDAIRWVPSAEFESAIRACIAAEAKLIKGPVALFIERELRHPGGHLQRFYKESPSKPRRAHGAALQPVESIRAYRPEVGSEGIIATIATSIARAMPGQFLLHPTAEEIRARKVRAFFILTDTIGTGSQAYEYLSALWRVASVKSWFSSKLISCHVIAFAATERGEQLLASHAMHPKVTWALRCPTIQSEFSEEDAQRITSLCMRYARSESSPSLGFGNAGVLIAYAHGLPNNAPTVLYKTSTDWTPLFRARSSGDLAGSLPTEPHQIDAAACLLKMGQSRLAASNWLSHLGPEAQQLVLVLASLSRSPRTDRAISKRTGLRLFDVQRLLRAATHYGWITEKLRLTDEGMRQLHGLRKRIQTDRANEEPLHNRNDMPYYPKSLRSP
jgi:hypothetical protein